MLEAKELRSIFNPKSARILFAWLRSEGNMELCSVIVGAFFLSEGTSISTTLMTGLESSSDATGGRGEVDEASPEEEVLADAKWGCSLDSSPKGLATSWERNDAGECCPILKALKSIPWSAKNWLAWLTTAWSVIPGSWRFEGRLGPTSW